ncbi:MAG: ATP-binding protein, partial [Terrimicrobiaceae bacterium]
LFADKATAENAFDQLYEKGVFRSEDLQISTNTGELRHLELVSNLYVEQRSKVFQFNIRDITDRVENARQLASARDAAESANRAKDKFLAALSHELRTPLTPVLIVASAMERSPKLPSELQRAFAMIRKNIKLEARLIDDLLDITGIAQGKLKFHFRNVDLHPLIQESIEGLRADIDKKEIQIKSDLSAPEHHVRADPVRLQQIFGNVLGNAIKFTPSSGQITVRSFNAGGNLHIEVADSGLGITEGELPRIFDEFAQGDEATSARFGGVGLGLFTADFLVRGHGGRIWAESAGRDKGATFHVELPLSSTPAPPPASPAKELPLAALRILLVEDHHSTRKTLAQFLTQRGHAVSDAESIAQARALAKADKFDIAICDLGLPDGRGQDLMHELKGEFSLPGIALSGYGMESDIQQSLEAGFSAHLTKPVELAALEEAIQRTLTVT